MILGVDIGNTNVVISAIENGTALFEERIATDTAKDNEYYIEWADGLSSLKQYSYEGSVLCSVVPCLDGVFREILTQLIGEKPVVLNYKNVDIDINVDNPPSVGNDLLAGAMGAKEFPYPQILIDIGTATTLVYMDDSGAFTGAVISAGAVLQLKALRDYTAQLPLVDMDVPPRLFGKNTVDSMRSGVIYGQAAMIDGFVAMAEKEYRSKPTVIMTGGVSKIVAPLCQSDVIYSPDLLMKGMWNTYMLNKGE